MENALYCEYCCSSRSSVAELGEEVPNLVERISQTSVRKYAKTKTTFLTKNYGHEGLLPDEPLQLLRRHLLDEVGQVEGGAARQEVQDLVFVAQIAWMNDTSQRVSALRYQ